MSIQSLVFYRSFVDPIVKMLGGIEHPDPDKAISNLNNNHEENLEYLGTYFPRTALESFSIINFLADKMPFIRESWARKDCIKVMDLGCGTGGELLGFLGAIRQIFGNNAPRVCLYVFDGNADALMIAEQVVSEFCSRTGIDVETRFERNLIEDKVITLECVDDGDKFDVILASKFLSEMNDYFSRPYYRISRLFLPLLADEGIALFMDVTCRRNGKWISRQMFNELGQCQFHDSEFKTLFPMVCNNQSCCRFGCDQFPQFVFDFADVGYEMRTKLAFRAMCRKDFWQRVRNETKPLRYWVKRTSEVAWCQETLSVGTAPLPEHCVNIPEGEAD